MPCFGSVHFSTVEEIPDRYFKENKAITGKVIAVHDGDGFRLFHDTEVGIFSLFSTPSPPYKRGMDLKSNTLNIRLAGIDAPETAKNGNPGQPFSEEAKEKLKKLVEGKTVKLRLLNRDQYGRAIAVVSIPKMLIFEQDVSIKLLESGLAVMYRGRDASYGGKKADYAALEINAKRAKRGIWSQKFFETPSEFKKIAKSQSNK